MNNPIRRVANQVISSSHDRLHSGFRWRRWSRLIAASVCTHRNEQHTVQCLAHLLSLQTHFFNFESQASFLRSNSGRKTIFSLDSWPGIRFGIRFLLHSPHRYFLRSKRMCHRVPQLQASMFEFHLYPSAQQCVLHCLDHLLNAEPKPTVDFFTAL
jgi:hypothetical protein